MRRHLYGHSYPKLINTYFENRPVPNLYKTLYLLSMVGQF